MRITRLEWTALFICIGIVLVLACSSCSALGGSKSPLVAYGTVSGDGAVRTDSNVFVGIGDLHGEAGIFMKGSGFPLTFPLNTSKEQWVAVSRDDPQASARGIIGKNKLPWWCASLFRPGELLELSNHFGVLIEVEDKPVPQPAPEPAPTT